MYITRNYIPIGDFMAMGGSELFSNMMRNSITVNDGADGPTYIREWLDYMDVNANGLYSYKSSGTATRMYFESGLDAANTASILATYE